MAYLNSFDPANIHNNYLGDLAAPSVANTPQSYSFSVPAGASFVVVVYGTTATTTGSYTISLSCTTPPPVVPPVQPGEVLISEFRTSGFAFSGNGGGNDFVELYNNTDSPITVRGVNGSTGWTLIDFDAPVGDFFNILITIPNGTVIPARGHYLIASARGSYELGDYASYDRGYTRARDIDDDTGVGLFRTTSTVAFTLANRLDAVGFNAFQGAAADLTREGAGLPAIGFNSQYVYSVVRKQVSGFPQDTNDNANDFIFVSKAAHTSDTGVPFVLGIPGPENLSSPVQRNGLIKPSLIAPSQPASASPNRVRSGTVVSEGAYGTLSIQRRFTNTTNQAITRLRFRVVDITTINSPNGCGGCPQADLRVLSSTGTVKDSQGNTVATVNGLVIDPPFGGGVGLNSSLSVTLPGGSLDPGASIDVQFLLGVQAEGNFRFFANVEALPGPATSPSSATKTGAARKALSSTKRK